jgi:hypothetical protein
MSIKAALSAAACVLLLMLAACARTKVSYPASTPPGELVPPTASPAPRPLAARDAIPAMRAEQARLDRGVYVVCIANDGSLPSGMSSSVASVHGWPILRDGTRVRAICPVIGRARIFHVLRTHDGAIVYDAKVIPVNGAPDLNEKRIVGLPLQYCSPYGGTTLSASCARRPSSAGPLGNVGRDFFFSRGGT